MRCSKSRRVPQDTTRHALELIGFALALAYVLFLAGCLFERLWLIDVAGAPIANDFVNVWAAGRLVLEGQPAAAYDWTIHREVEVAALGHDFDGYYGWHYPPLFLFAGGRPRGAALSHRLGRPGSPITHAGLCRDGARHHRRAARHRCWHARFRA